MKYLLIFIATITIGQTHNFKEVNHNGKTLKNVQLVLNDSKEGFVIWYKDKLLKRGAYMIVSCRAKEGVCLVDNDSNYNFMKDTK